MLPPARCAIFVVAVCAVVSCSSALVEHSASGGGGGGGGGSRGGGGGGGGGDSELLSAIDRSSRAAAEAVMDALSTRLDLMKTELSAQLEGIQTDLESQLDRLETRLVTRMRRVEAQLDDVTSQVTSQVRDVQTALTVQNTDLSARLQDTQTQMETRLVAGSDSMFSRLVDVQSQMLTVLLTPRDCSDLPDSATSGIYLLWPSPNRAVPGYCDLSTAGGNWTVIQRRADITPRQSFDLGWESYGRGFGSLIGEFWWGNENLFRLTTLQGRHYELRVELEDPDGETRTAAYSTFRVSSVKEDYRLSVSGYSGDAGDSLAASSGQKFSTKDRDQDESGDNCAELWEAGWWFGECPHSNPNGPYLFNVSSSSLYGVVWPAWQEATSLKVVEMKIRPTESPATGVVKEP